MKETRKHIVRREGLFGGGDERGKMGEHIQKRAGAKYCICLDVVEIPT